MVELSNLNRKLVKKTGEEESVRPALFLSLYSGQPIVKLAPHAAAALRTYLDVIPKDVLRSALIGDNVGPLTTNRITRDLRRLENPPRNFDCDQLRYSSSSMGQPGDFGITFLLDDFADSRTDAETNLLRFEFPWDFAEGDRMEPFLKIVTQLADKLPFSVGTCGFGFSHWHPDRFAVEQVYSMLPRYIGFEHSSERPGEHMRGRTPSPQWLTLLNKAIMDQLGGVSALKDQVPGAQIRELKNGYMIMAAKCPPIGDVNLGAKDIGLLPALARWLKPLRASIPSLRGNAVELDASDWLARFDGLECGPWENR